MDKRALVIEFGTEKENEIVRLRHANPTDLDGVGIKGAADTIVASGVYGKTTVGVDEEQRPVTEVLTAYYLYQTIEELEI